MVELVAQSQVAQKRTALFGREGRVSSILANALVLTASCDPDDIKKSYVLGAGAYLVKPHGEAARFQQTEGVDENLL